MAVPSAADRKRRPILLSLSLFLLLSALLVLIFLFLGPSTQSLAFLPSRLASTPSTPSLPTPHHHQHSPTPIPTPGSSSDSHLNAPASSVEKADASTPDAPSAVAVPGGSGTSDPSRPVHDTTGYRLPVPWPRSRDMIWYNNVPHPKLVEYKKDQKWVTKSGDYLVFPGGGTQFKDGVARYIQFVEQIMPTIQWGTHTRTVLDVGCGVASFGGYLLDRNVITMSLAPKDEHEAQIQFALERGIPAFLGVIGTQKLPFPDNAFDVVHCARCRVRWYENGGKPLLELNRVLRPGGFFIWSATPVYREEKRDQDDWNAMVTLTKSICWSTVVKSQDINGIGVVIYQKPASNSCYLERKTNQPHLCSEKDGSRFPWYASLDSCILPTASDETKNSPLLWPERLVRYTHIPYDSATTEKFDADTMYWKQVISDVHSNDFPVNWSSVRNVMDMNAGYGGFAAALVDQPLWVMNVVPIGQSDTLPVIFSRGLIGVYHDWCESFNTYPRTYDVLHMSDLLGSLTKRCDILDVAAEVDRILRPGRWFVLQDTMDMIKRMRPVLRSLHYETVVVKRQYLVATKSFWRPGASRSG